MRMVAWLCAILCGVALTWICAATGLIVFAALTRRGCGVSPRAALRQVRQIENILWQYRIDHQRCPATWNALIAEGYVRTKDIVDPWGKDIAYWCPEDSDGDPRVVSAGPDKTFGTADDVKDER